ncbi:Endoplasmic reticulum zinc transporter [Gryganskiella cystojenkinii]|nr:Endoplasmic reticulum zinc transporter [Gryganskiella cystojenkinii]
MDSSPQLLRRTHSPFVAAAAAAASSTVAVDTHGHQAHHHGHNNHQGTHQHHHHQSHLSPLPNQGVRPTGMSSPSIGLDSAIAASSSNGLLQLKKPLTGAVPSSSSSVNTMNGNIPFASSATHGHGHAHSLSHTHGNDAGHHDHSSPFDQQHHHGHTHDSHDGHGHAHSHNDHSHQHHDHHHSHDHSHGSIGQTNGFQVSAPAGLFGQDQHQHHGHDHHHHGHDSHSHDHHGHDHGHAHAHDQHDHHHGPSHDSNNHGFAAHQHHGHGHDHAHAHDHQGHGHGHSHGHDHDHHHGHGHDHDHHGHSHVHHPVSFRSQLPSYGEIFGNLMPKQKTMFTWILAHSSIAVLTWLSGMRAGSLSIIGLSYMLLFDAFGVLNIFISSVIHTDIKMKKSTVKHPFGVQRFEILFGLFNAIFLLFIGMNMLKESLEHLMLEDDHHGGDHGAVVRVPLFWTMIALGATLISSLGYQNHKQFCLLLSSNSMSSQSAYASSSSTQVLRNQFTLLSLSCVVGVVLVAMFPHADSLDKIIAIGQSLAMFTLGGPLCKVLGMLLLQTTPPKALEGVEEAVRHLSATNPQIVRLERAHVWTNTYGQLIGTLMVSVTKGSDEQSLLAIIHQRLQGFLDLDSQSEGTGELTVQLVSH